MGETQMAKSQKEEIARGRLEREAWKRMEKLCKLAKSAKEDEEISHKFLLYIFRLVLYNCRQYDNIRKLHV